VSARSQDIPRVAVDVCSIDDLPESTPTPIAVGKRTLMAIRIGEQVFVASAVCPHRGGPLGCGQVRYPLRADHVGDLSVDHERPTIACPWHGWEFDLSDGTAIADPSLRIKMFATEISEGRLRVYART
jgi:nitrite reductase (NADH) small subunit